LHIATKELAMATAPEFTVGKEVEINFPQRHDGGVWGVDDDFYGMALLVEVTKVDLPLVRAKITAQGFYGAYDGPESPIRGKPVNIEFDVTRIKFHQWADRLRIEF